MRTAERDIRRFYISLSNLPPAVRDLIKTLFDRRRGPFPAGALTVLPRNHRKRVHSFYILCFNFPLRLFSHFCFDHFVVFISFNSSHLDLDDYSVYFLFSRCFSASFFFIYFCLFVFSYIFFFFFFSIGSGTRPNSVGAVRKQPRMNGRGRKRVQRVNRERRG